MNELLRDHGRVIDLTKKSLTLLEMQDLLKKIENNKRVGHIIWGKNTNSCSIEVQKKIEEKIIQNNKNHFKHPNDFIYALLSSFVYKDSKQEERVEFKNANKVKFNQYLLKWKFQKTYDKPEAGKYYAATFINESEYQLVLAHRGISKLTIEDLLKSDSPLRSDILEVLGREIVAQLKEEYFVTKEVVAYAEDIGYQLSVTGLSLGTWLAELTVYFCAAKFHYAAKAVTFESPGSKGIENICSNIIKINTEKLSDCINRYSDLLKNFLIVLIDIVTYLKTF
nr:uncharacterized protein LOC124816955 [Hydra vulgaris]